MAEILTFDTETSIYNKGNPFDVRNKLVSIHTKLNENKTICKFYNEPDFLSEINSCIDRVDMVIGLNLKFDIHWLKRKGISLRNGCRVWDCMVAEFVLSGQTNSFASLNSLAEKYGLQLKHPVVAEYWDQGISTEDIPREIVEEYGNWDVDLTYLVYLKQREDPRMTPKLKRLILLEGADLLVLQKMEYNGLKYNKEKSLQLAADANKRIEEIQGKLLELAGIKKLNFDSDDQLSSYLYGGSYSEDVYAPHTAITKSGPNKGKERTTNRFVRTDVFNFDGFFKPIKGSELKKEGKFSTSGDVLKQLRASSKLQRLIVELLLERADLAKLSGTYYEGIPKLMTEMHWDDGYIHGQFNQVVARTGRLSSSKPNLQNMSEDGDFLIESRYED